MAPPTPFNSKYDQDIKKHIIEVRDRTTGQYKKYIYNDAFKQFEAAPEPAAVFERDLEPLYQSECSRHSNIIFCRNKKAGGKIFKYKAGDERGPWQKVQCLCCHFEHKPENPDWVELIKKSMNLDKPVDDDKYSYLWFQPVFSKFCQNTGKITVFASIYPHQDRLLAWNFDLEKLNFVPAECQQECCQMITGFDRRISPRAFDFGSQGKYFARSHHDQTGRPLICLAISWYNSEHGQMEIFLDSDGDIGRYEWNDKCQCFDLVETLDVRTLNHNDCEEVKIMKPEIWYDDGLRLLYPKECPTLRDTIFFSWHVKDGKTRKYVFNPICLQFNVVKCQCCVFDASLIIDKEENTHVAIYTCNTTSTKLMIRSNKDGCINKELFTYAGEQRTLQKSPIRIDSHLMPHEFGIRRVIENNVPHMIQILISKKDEAWVIRRFRLGSDGKTATGTVVLMDGSVKPFYYDQKLMEYAIFEPDCADLAALKKTNPNASPHVNCDRYALDWDLTPRSLAYCTHFNNHFITAYNHFTNSTHTYVYNGSTGHLHENSGCETCQKERMYSIGPNQVIFGAASPQSKRAIILSTNSEGRLMKIGENSHSKVYCGMVPSRVLTEKDVQFLGEQNASKTEELIRSGRIPEKKLHEETVARLETRVMEAEKKIKDTETQNNMLSEEKTLLEKQIMELEQQIKQLNEGKKEMEKEEVEEKEELPVEEEKVTIVQKHQPLSTDHDLSPMYRNFCKHTGHFLITAFNRITETTSHYVFNPDTLLFHHQDYCSLCPSYENGVKVNSFVIIMPIQSMRCKFPYLIMTDETRRLVKIGFDSISMSFVLISPAVIQNQVESITEITNSICYSHALEIPNTPGPHDTDLCPKFRIFCTHISEFLIFAIDCFSGTEGFYLFNSATGHMEEHDDCPSCRTRSPVYIIEKMRSIMAISSPYSRWPIMLTTDKDGMFVPIGYDTSSQKFEKMHPLAIKLLKNKEEKTEEKSEVNFVTDTVQMNPVENEDDDDECSDEEEEYSDEEEEYSDEEEEYSDEEESGEDEEDEEEEVDEDLLVGAQIINEIRHMQIAPNESEHDDEDCSDEEYYCSDEECSDCYEECSDEECSDEECSDEECSDEECSDEECSDEECSDEECSDEECSDEECSDEEDECCSDEECCCDEEDECAEEAEDEDSEALKKEATNADKAEDNGNFVLVTEEDIERDVPEFISNLYRFGIVDQKIQRIIDNSADMLEKYKKLKSFIDQMYDLSSKKTVEATEGDDVPNSSQNPTEQHEIRENNDVVEVAADDNVSADMTHQEETATTSNDIKCVELIENDREDAESTATALENDQEDVESTTTALDHSDVEEDVEVIDEDQMSTATATDGEQDDVESTVTALDISDISDSAEFVNEHDIDDASSTATAIEGDQDDVESTATALDVSDISDSAEFINGHDIDDASSTATAIEGEQDDVESVTTALDHSDLEDDIEIIGEAPEEDPQETSSLELDITQDNEDTQSTTTALEISDSESDVSLVDAEPDVSDIEDREDTESVHTALEPDVATEDDIEMDNVSMLSSTSTAREPSIANDDESSIGSDISYLDTDFSVNGDEPESEMVKSNYEDCNDQLGEAEPEGEERPVAQDANTCIIS
ncbi:hypothetical protein CRE_28419 [Caenorhabditis remanei]|uniref:TNFR-Cys domain-containing protein n=1 Tax=Caenorhabditis remanei TaxID=31234 RepID=E3LMB5_CAERE|nr:hypothetical protein CRE_28419 [Caenorhabditis remanei]